MHRSLSVFVFLLGIVMMVALTNGSPIDSYHLDASSKWFKYTYGRTAKMGKSVQFDWAGLWIHNSFVYRENASMASNDLSVTYHLQDVKNMYNVHVWMVDENNKRSELLQELVLDTGSDLPNGYVVDLSWNKMNMPSYKVEIILEKRTEAELGIVTFSGLTFGVGKENVVEILVPSSKPKQDPANLKMEFVGDSYTCGFGNMGKPPCDITPQTQNVHESFVEKTARYLNVEEIHIACMSGKGVVKNWDDSTWFSKDPVPAYYPRALANNASSLWDFESFIPDMVVITLGTNDFVSPVFPTFEQFTHGYQVFLDFIFHNYQPFKPHLKAVIVVSL